MAKFADITGSYLYPELDGVRVRVYIWMYSQGAAPVFKGDLFYYSFEHDLRQTAKNIDTRKCALYVVRRRMFGEE
jgi:hypothetical protein